MEQPHSEEFPESTEQLINESREIVAQIRYLAGRDALGRHKESSERDISIAITNLREVKRREEDTEETIDLRGEALYLQGLIEESK